MTPNIAMISDGKKFMWDGQVYENKDEALRASQSYEGDNFQLRTIEQEGKFLLYTRRVVKQVVAPA